MENFQAKLKQCCCFLPKIVFKCIGINFHGGKTSKFYKVFSVFMLFMNATYGVTGLHSVFYNLDNFDVVIDSVFNMIAGWIATFIAIFMVYNLKNLEKLCKDIERLQKEHNTEERSQKLVYSVNKKVLAIIVVFCSFLSTLFIYSMIQRRTEEDSRKWSIPTMDVTIINKTYSPNFEIAWLYMLFAVPACALCFCFSDILVATIMADITVQFYLLSSRIKRTFTSVSDHRTKGDELQKNNLLWKTFRQNVKDIVIHHLSLIDLVNDAENVCSVIAFLNVMGNLGMIGSSLYYASVMPLLDFRVLQSILEIFMITMALFLICYWGTQISFASESVGTACYELNFVGTDVRFQKDLLMIMMRCQRPIELTVGKFTVLSITVFVWIIRSSYSYLMVLRKSNENHIHR